MATDHDKQAEELLRSLENYIAQPPGKFPCFPPDALPVLAQALRRAEARGLRWIAGGAKRGWRCSKCGFNTDWPEEAAQKIDRLEQEAEG